LPDGSFSNQKSKFGKILVGLAIEDVGIFYGHLVHFTVFCYILLTFGIVSGNLVYFSRFGILYQEQSGNPNLTPKKLWAAENAFESTLCLVTEHK
jgi:hypothetical protein